MFIIDKLFGFIQIAVLLLFIITVFGRAIYLGRRYRKQFLIRDNEASGAKRFADYVFFIGTILWIIKICIINFGSRFAYIYDIKLYEYVPIRIVGLVIIVLMFIVYLWALNSMKSSWRIGIDRKSAGALITGGIFKYSRNPIYVMMNLYTFGVFLTTGSLVLLVAAIATTVYTYIQIRAEEQFLSEEYGAEFEEYKSKVGRYFSIRSVR